MTGPVLAIQEAAEGASVASGTIVGVALLATAGLDLLLAFFFGFVKPPPEGKARVVLPLALAGGALVLAALGV